MPSLIKTKGPTTRRRTPANPANASPPELEAEAPPGVDTLNSQLSTLNSKSLLDLKSRLAHNFARVEAILTKLEQGDEDAQTQIAAAAEMRQNIALAQKMTETILKTEALQNVENLVISILSEAGPTVRRKLIDKLNEAANPP